MKLIHRKEIKIVTDYWDVEKLIQEVYGLEYEIVPMEEWSNDEQHSYSVKKGDIPSYDRSKLESFLQGNQKNYSLGTILQDLCNKGELEEGDYLINVCW